MKHKLSLDEPWRMSAQQIKDICGLVEDYGFERMLLNHNGEAVLQRQYQTQLGPITVSYIPATWKCMIRMGSINPDGTPTGPIILTTNGLPFDAINEAEISKILVELVASTVINGQLEHLNKWVDLNDVYDEAASSGLYKHPVHARNAARHWHGYNERVAGLQHVDATTAADLLDWLYRRQGAEPANNPFRRRQ